MALFKKNINEEDIELLVQTRETKDINQFHNEQLTFGERLADKIAAFAGSWPFIISFFVILLSWVIFNLTSLMWDPYPFILLNLGLSSIASVQAPIIMMSQNRQAKKDSLISELDYKLNLKSEIVHEETMKRLNKIDENQKVILGNQIKIINTLYQFEIDKSNTNK